MLTKTIQPITIQTMETIDKVVPTMSKMSSSYEEEEPTLSEYGQSIINMYNSANSETVRTMTPGLTRTVNKQIVNLIDRYKGEGKLTDSDVRILIDRLNLE